MFDIFHTLFKYKEKESPDVLGSFPEKVHVGAFPERRYLWTTRLLVIFSCLSISLNMMLASAIYVMLPMRRVSPSFYTINKHFNQIEQVQKREVSFPVSDLITEQYIRNYLLLRYTITSDKNELRKRWKKGSPIYWYSAPAVYNEFVSIDALPIFTQLKKNPFEREIEIEWVRPLSKNFWQTQFKTFTYIAGTQKTKIEYWRATLRIFYAKIPFEKKEDALLNPYGFVVASYSLAFHGEEDTAKSLLKEEQKRK